MPKSRMARGVRKANRLEKRLAELARKSAMYESILKLTDDAIQGAGLEAIYHDQPVPHVELRKME